MARSAAEKQRREVTDKAIKEVREKHPDAVEILPSWAGVDLVFDVRLPTNGTAQEWVRYMWSPKDSLETHGIQELA